MNTLELINTLLDTIIPNELVHEIIKDSIAIHSKSDPIVVAKTADKWSPLSDVEVAYYKPDTHSRGEVLAKNELADYDPISVKPCIVLWPKG